MKAIRFCLVLLCLFSGISTHARIITRQEAFQKAQQFVYGKSFKQSRLRTPQKEVTNAGYYVFNIENEGGFVIVAGDDRMKDILGYSEKGSFNMEEIPDNLKWLLDYYAQIASSSFGAPLKSNASASSANRPELQPLVTTTWDQGDPYNAQCPEVDGQKPLTGCVATAMAQVINYFQWPISEARSVADYTTKTLNLYVPSLSARKFMWSNMNNDEMAWLMRYCGQSVQMDYTSGESGARAIDIAGALVSVFDYSKTAKLVIRDSYTDEEWEELMYRELSVGRPVIYNGGYGQGEEATGHSFILHGYRDGLFYVNWGWSGQCDGYFALTNLSPNELQHYTENQNAIIAIQPSSNNDDAAMEAAEARTIHLQKAGTLSNFISEKDKYNIKSLTLSGELNGSDFVLIRDMAHVDWEGNGGRLETLDIQNAKIVKGGTPYMDLYTTEDNVVGSNLFWQCNVLQTIVLPKGITAIGNGAFSESDLRAFVVPKTVTSIGSGIFFACRNLSQLEVEEGNPNYYSIPNSNAIIERSTQRLIAGCPNTVIPEGITTIASSALACNVPSIKLPESLTTIESDAFYGASLISLHIPKNVKSIAPHAFSSNNLQAITVDSENAVYDSRDNSNCLIEKNTKTVLLGCLASQIPEGVEAIDELAFRGNYNVTSITLPQSLKSIGMFAFEGCALRNLDLPASVTDIGSRAFGSNRYLRTCKVRWDTPPSIPEDVFFGVSQEAILIVPVGTKAKYQAVRGWNVFNTIIEESEYMASRTLNVSTAGTLSSLIPENDRSTLQELILTGNLNNDDFQFIREHLSQGVLRVLDMTNATIENNILDQEALKFTPTLEEVRLPNTLQAIGSNAFWESGIKSIVIPKSVIELGPDIFYQCHHLASIRVEAGNTVFDSRDNCNAIIETATNVLRIGCRSSVVPQSVVKIGRVAFSGVNGLTSVDLPNGVTAIGEYAFWADMGLTTIRLSKSVTQLGEGPFVGCANVKSFVIDPENPVYDSRDNCNAIIETATNTLIQGFGTTKIPETVVKIAPSAFMYQNLTYMEIPASVQEIGAAAFMYCNELTTVVSHIKKPYPLNTSVFSGDNMRTAVLYVPYGTKKAYSTTAGWGSFPKIIEMEPNDEDYGHYAASVVNANFGKQYAGLNGQTFVPVYVLGESIDPITNIDYTITMGSNVQEGHLDVDPIGYMMTAQVLIPFNADATIGEQTKTLTITKVNSVNNEATEKSASGILVTVKRKPKFVPLIEEATGSWCGWCPRGVVGLNLLNKTFRDDVVTVAVHSNDPMELPGYALNATGFPSCQINRGSFIDPYYGSSDLPFGIKYDIEAVQRDYTIGEIDVKAAWKDDKQTAINVTTTATFVEDVASSPYQIGYLLLEDGQTGTTSDWAQSNYYSSSANNDANLKGLVNSPSKIVGMKHNHVPVAVWQHESGIEGSLPTTITSEVPMKHTYTLDISGITRIQNKAKLTVVALLLNKNTHEVLNAAKFKFAPDLIDGDANGDEIVDATDIVEVVNAIKGKPSILFNADAADVNHDGIVNAADIVMLVNMIMKM